MDSTHLTAFQQQLERLRATLLEQIVQQRGGTKGRAEVAAQYCTDCDAAIPTARLQATPEVARCITCQDKAEHAHI